MSDTPIYDEVLALMTARADRSSHDEDLDPYEAPTGCSWCGLPLDDIDGRRALLVQDPVAGDDVLLGACCSEHADRLRRRYRVPT